MTHTTRKPPEVWSYREGDRVSYVGIRLSKIGAAGRVIAVNHDGSAIVVRLDDGELMGACLPTDIVPLDPQEHNYQRLDPNIELRLVRLREQEAKYGLGHQVHRRFTVRPNGPVPAPGPLDGAEGQKRPTGDG